MFAKFNYYFLIYKYIYKFKKNPVCWLIFSWFIKVEYLTTPNNLNVVQYETHLPEKI